MSSNPYQSLPPIAFWRTAVASQDPQQISGLWTPKHPITSEDRIATFGSCFAQHISRALASRGFSWLDAEKPDGELSQQEKHDRNYGIFSARTGNIYSAAALRQWIDWAVNISAPPEEVWVCNDRYYDPFRPTIEPGGFASESAMKASRAATLAALRTVIAESKFFIFTLGLTEAWIHRQRGYTYAACPGTSEAGEFDPSQHAFKNYEYPEILADMEHVIAVLRDHNPGIKIILTVSPVPLTATASGEHVLVATTKSKSILRAVAGKLADSFDDADYFPSYEIITGAPFRARFFESNLRTIAPAGVDFVMRSFFRTSEPIVEESADDERSRGIGRPRRQRPSRAKARDLVCEEELLDAFAPGKVTGPASNPDATKICVIGNSHAGALQRALSEGLFVDPALDFTFWVFPGNEYNEIKFVDGRLTHPNAALAKRFAGNGHESIRPQDFEVLVFISAFAPDRLFSRRSRLRQLKRMRRMAKKGLFSRLLRTVFSRSHRPFPFERQVRRLIEKNSVFQLMLSAKESYTGPILCLARPMMSEATRESSDKLLSTEQLQTVNNTIAKTLRDQRFIFIPQPAETIVDGFWTKQEYAGPNAGHMNGRFGALILADIRAQLHRHAAAKQLE